MAQEQLLGALRTTLKGLGHQGEDMGWGLAAGDVASAGQGEGQGLRLLWCMGR